MEKKYAYNLVTGEKLFCKTEMLPSGILAVDYYLPKYGFSVIWHHGKYVTIRDCNDTMDGRKCRVTFCIHPAFWLGDGFNASREFFSQQEAIDYVFTTYIKTKI